MQNSVHLLSHGYLVSLPKRSKLLPLHLPDILIRQDLGCCLNPCSFIAQLVNSLSVMFILSEASLHCLTLEWNSQSACPRTLHWPASLKCAELAFSQTRASCLSSVINCQWTMCQFDSVLSQMTSQMVSCRIYFHGQISIFSDRNPDCQNICHPTLSLATV